jgi:5-methyltetrahydropteroyltriglutamate--homocysteine methyltransferase
LNRILTTHTGSLIRPPELTAFLAAMETVMGGTDCGFAQGAMLQRVHPEIQWAKLEALATGARIATRHLWGAKAA